MKIVNRSKAVFKAGSALHALSLLGAGIAATTVLATPAMAQDYTSGSIGGTVADENGNPVSGATVTLTSQAQGFTRTATTSSTGTFRFASLPTGDYNISVDAPGTPGYLAEGVRVLASQSASVNIELSSGSEGIVVTGSRIVTRAFEGTTTGLNIDLEELVKTVPLSRDLTSVVLLAPGTTAGDATFGNLASIGGSSVAENAYYVNGLNITNFDNYLGGGTVPFEFYRSVEVKSGGYPAEFGRATGGIVNTVTKAGSNEFRGAIHLNWTPEWLTSKGKDLQTCQYADPVANTGLTCSNLTNRAGDENSNYSAIIEGGGPIIADRLFVYGLVEFRETNSLTIDRSAATAYERKNNDPFWGIKVDAYPLDNHHLEFTVFDTRNTTTRSDRAYSEVDGQPVLGLANSVSDFNFGGVNFVGKYTGNLTDWLTVSAAYGKYRDRFDNIGVAGAAGQAYNRNLSGGTVNGVSNGGYFTGQTVTSTTFPYETEREFYRADVDLFVNLFGEHHFRAGFDLENNSLAKASVRNGGDFLFSNNRITAEAYNTGNGGAGFLYILRAGGQVELNYFNSGGVFDAQNKSFYIQDEWSVTDRLTLNLGVRRDDFRVDAADGSAFAKLEENYAPRIGVTYNLWPDRSGKLYGFYGQYFLPFASNTAFRNTGSEYYLRERFLYTGFDSNGLPILGDQVTTRSDYQNTCPFALTPQSSGQNCNVTGDGSVSPSSAYLSSNLKATRETEYILGYEHDFGQFSAGINYIHRNLDVTAEDGAIDAAVINYCNEQGIAGCESTWTGYHQYILFNPGESATVDLLGLDGRTVTFTAEELGYPAAERTYDAVEFTLNRKWDGDFSIGGSYTWSKSKGNSEGFVQSDFGQDDAGITQDFDQPGFTDYAYGNLPNDRRHRIKLFGAVALSDAFTLGGNLRIDSPRSLSCFGYHPTDVFGNGYGAASHYCGGQPSARGTAQDSQWVENLDISARYKFEFNSGQTVTLRADVFNLFNSQSIQTRNEFGDRDVTTDPVTGVPVTYLPNPNYGIATGYQTPRSVRLGLDVAF